MVHNLIFISWDQLGPSECSVLPKDQLGQRRDCVFGESWESMHSLRSRERLSWNFTTHKENGRFQPFTLDWTITWNAVAFLPPLQLRSQNDVCPFKTVWKTYYLYTFISYLCKYSIQIKNFKSQMTVSFCSQIGSSLG